MVESYKFDSEQAEVTVASRHIEKHSYTSKLGLHHYLHASPQKQDDKMYMSDEFKACNFQDLAMDAESNWANLPRGSKKALFGRAGMYSNNDFDAIIEAPVFFIFLPSLFMEDHEYDWNLWLSKRSAYVLAADLWLNGKFREALLMRCYAAFIEESLARGMHDIIIYFHGYKTQRSSKAILNVEHIGGSAKIEYNMDEIYSHFTFLYSAIFNTKTGKDMLEYLVKKLKEFPGTKKWIGRMSRMRSMPARVHTSNLDIESKPQELMTLTCMINNRKFFDIALYRDTSLNWLFSAATAASQTFGYGILKPGLKANLKEHFRYHIQVYLHFLSSGKDYYLLTNAKKTLSELGIHDRDIFQPCQTYGEQPKVKVATKQNITKSGKKKEKKQKRSVKPKKQPLKQSYNGEETLREIHSKSMEPVLNELRPLLKIRRDKIASYYNQNSTSKKKKGSTKVAAKRTKDDAHIVVPNHLGGKAGKSVYKVVVGETTNLYKTSKFKSLSCYKIITLDLHGCSRYKAMGLLRKNLQEWVDLAMKGEYPFLIPCDIICGGGNQLLSEIVAQFIRDSPQVANRRKGI